MSFRRSILATLVLGGLGLTAACPAFASMTSQSEFSPENFGSASKIDIGGMAGAGILSNSGGSHLGFGLTAGYRFDPFWQAAAFFNHIDRGTIRGAETGVLGAANTDATLNLYGAEIN